MKTNVVMTRKMGEFNVDQRTKDGMFNATAVAKQWNVANDKRKDTSEFLSNKATRRFIINHNCKYSVKKGKNGGTWMDEELFNYFLKWLKGESSQNHYRSESVFFDTLESVVNSEEELISIKKQYPCLNYKIDGVITETVDNCGDYDSDSETVNVITLFEFDEKHHRSNVEEDNQRIDEITEELRKDFANIIVYRIPEESSNVFLMYAIPYYSGVETSYSRDKMHSFIYKHR